MISSLLNREAGSLESRGVLRGLLIFACVIASVAIAPMPAQQPQTDAVRHKIASINQAVSSGPFTPDWNSLGAYRVPE